MCSLQRFTNIMYTKGIMTFCELQLHFDSVRHKIQNLNTIHFHYKNVSAHKSCMQILHAVTFL